MTGLLHSVVGENSMNAVGSMELLKSFSNSIVLGLILVLSTYWIMSRAKLQKTENEESDRQKQIMGAANMLFLSVGLCGVMLIVNNNLVRALAVFAAIALIRFRVKLDGKSPNASYLFAVLSGMACGVGEIAIAWSVTGVYLLLLLSLAVVVRLTARDRTHSFQVLRMKTEEDGLSKATSETATQS